MYAHTRVHNTRTHTNVCTTHAHTQTHEPHTHTNTEASKNTHPNTDGHTITHTQKHTDKRASTHTHIHRHRYRHTTTRLSLFILNRGTHLITPHPPMLFSSLSQSLHNNTDHWFSILNVYTKKQHNTLLKSI